MTDDTLPNVNDALFHVLGPDRPIPARPARHLLAPAFAFALGAAVR